MFIFIKYPRTNICQTIISYREFTLTLAHKLQKWCPGTPQTQAGMLTGASKLVALEVDSHSFVYRLFRVPRSPRVLGFLRSSGSPQSVCIRERARHAKGAQPRSVLTWSGHAQAVCGPRWGGCDPPAPKRIRNSLLKIGALKHYKAM